jgi:uncharacterized protein YdhG (YjbR/CyaY superfamily)
MGQADVQTVADYLAAQPEATRRVLERVRRAIRSALPGAEEVISYKIPTYRVDGRTVLFFAGWKRHYSIYPATDRVVAALRTQLEPYVVENGTIRFPLSEPVPVQLIGRIAKLRTKEIAERKQARKKSGTRKR